MRDRHSPPSRRAFLGMTAAAAVALPRLAGAESRALDRIGGRAFGTLWRITGPAGTDLHRLTPKVARLLAEVDRQMSPWRPDSEISQFNAGAAGGHGVSADTAHVTRAALGLAGASGGCFDPTVGPLVARWGFGPITGGATGWGELSVEDTRIVKARADLTLDLCGIAKGWALDRVAALAVAQGHKDLLIDIGGELAGIGTHPSGRPWQVAVENPLAGHTDAAAFLALSDSAVATSGTRAQSYGVGGPDYGHIIDPVTGTPARGALRSVSVVAGDAMTADGWATALFAAGLEGGPELARRNAISALFLFETEGGLRRDLTGAMAGVLL